MSALWTARDAALATGVRLLPGADWVAYGVSIDTRAVANSDLFIALKGPRFDGHDFVGTALANGAAAAMVDRVIPNADPGRLLCVPDTQAGLEALAADEAVGVELPPPDEPPPLEGVIELARAPPTPPTMAARPAYQAKTPAASTAPT